MKKRTIMLISLVLIVTLTVAGTLAYLTDRESEVNVFTVGNVSIKLEEAFEQDSALLPGVNITKKPVITNVGDNDAWVWMTFSIPSALDYYAQGTETGANDNTIHWNAIGATTDGYVTDDRVQNAIASGYLDDGLTADIIKNSKMTWNVFNSLGQGQNVYQEKIDGVDYNTYVLLYNKKLTKNETTLPSIYNVFLDSHVDIDPDGNMYRIENGNVTELDWNINEDGGPRIYVSAYAIQADGFDSVEKAYAAYNTQWGDNGSAIGADDVNP